jgi:hypothetical protein
LLKNGKVACLADTKALIDLQGFTPVNVIVIAKAQTGRLLHF